MNWKTWLLVLVVGIGLMFEAFKHLPVGTGARLFDKDNFAFGTSNVRPYSVKINSRALIAKTHPLPVSASAPIPLEDLRKFVAANAVQQTDFENKDKDGETATAKKKRKSKALKADEEWEIIIDPATGKKYRRRKKKVAEQKPADAVANISTPDKKPDSSDNDINGMVQNAVVTGELQPVASTDKDAFVSLEEWIRRLLTQPDAKMTNLFIQQYRSSLVGADIFYKITALMLADSRMDMKALGALCAGMTPSQLSFQLLAGAQKTETAGTPLRQSIDGFLQQYTNLENLSYLQRVLSGTDSYSVVLAALLLDQSATRFLQGSAPGTTVTGSATETQGTSLAVTNGPRFKQFLPILQTLTHSQDASVLNQATNTYNDLQRLLGTSTTVTSTTASNEP